MKKELERCKSDEKKNLNVVDFQCKAKIKGTESGKTFLSRGTWGWSWR